MTATVEETLEHLDFDHEIECESLVECANRADGYVERTCCSNKSFLCLRCWNEIDTGLALYELLKKPLGCTACGFKGLFRDDFRWYLL
jgi:DNA-directed RNA polymerase subunit RPC12/RpoP